MRYELYGISKPDGSVSELGTFRSRKAALDAVDGINSTVTPLFMVLETPRKSAVPLGFYAGRVRDGYASLAVATYVQVGVTPGKSEILSPDFIWERVIKKIGA